jgi:hypothetical protein
LDFIWILLCGLKFEMEIQIRIKTRIQRIEKTLHCFAGRQPPNQPILALGPSAGPTSRPATATYRARHRVASKRVPRTASPSPHDDARASAPTFGLWLTPKAKGGRAGHRARRRRMPPPPGASRPSACPIAARPYLSRRRAPGRIPTLAA